MRNIFLHADALLTFAQIIGSGMKYSFLTFTSQRYYNKLYCIVKNPREMSNFKSLLNRLK